MGSISLSLNDMQKAISIIKVAKPNMQENWYDWVENIVVDDAWNKSAFSIIKEKYLAGSLFEIKDLEGTDDLKRVYDMHKPIRFNSKEYFKIGRGSNSKEYRLNLMLYPIDIVNALEIEVNNKAIPNTYIISCNDRFIIKNMDNIKLKEIKELCEILQLSADYNLYDCSNYDVTNMSRDNILSNLHRFRKLL